MELKKKTSWRDVTINEYFDLVERLSDESLKEYEKIVIKIAFVNNLDEESVWAMNINEFRKLQVESIWLDEFNIKTDIKFKNITIGNNKYIIDTNLQNFSVSQYIDFQSFYPKYKKDKKVIGNILACFIIPVGKQYADGYDIQDLVRQINESIDIMTAQEIMFFFLKQYLISMRATANYFNWQMKKRMKKMKDKQKAAELMSQWEEAKKNILTGLRLSTMLAS